ncbi:MAG: hypothetical protein ACXWYE_03765 [Actinomycetota bacterium]
MSDTLTYAIELAVGLGCLAAAVGLWRRASLRALAVLFAVGGVAAAVHAVWALATGTSP